MPMINAIATSLLPVLSFSIPWLAPRDGALQRPAQGRNCLRSRPHAQVEQARVARRRSRFCSAPHRKHASLARLMVPGLGNLTLIAGRMGNKRRMKQSSTQSNADTITPETDTTKSWPNLRMIDLCRQRARTDEIHGRLRRAVDRCG